MSSFSIHQLGAGISMNREIVIRRLKPEDAPALTALIRRCYSETYGPSIFYDTPILAEMISKQKLCSVVAVSGPQIVGHMGLTVRHSESIVCETGNTVVDQNVRGQGLLLKLGMALHNLVLQGGYAGYIHYPTTAHHIIQRASVAYGGKETGVMLSYVSETTGPELTDKQSHPLAATVVFQPFSPAPNRKVMLPAKYHTVIKQLYENLSLDRSLITSPPSLGKNLTNSGTPLVTDYCSKRGRLHLFVKESTSNMTENVSALIEKYQPKITHIDLSLDNVDIDSIVNSLNNIGFFFCALLPEFAHTDLLRLQAITSLVPDDLELNLINEDAISLGDFICKSAC